jgi:hypothetical protein
MDVSWVLMLTLLLTIPLALTLQHIGSERYPDGATSVSRRIEQRRGLVGLGGAQDRRYAAVMIGRKINSSPTLISIRERAKNQKLSAPYTLVIWYNDIATSDGTRAPSGGAVARALSAPWPLGSIDDYLVPLGLYVA